MGYPSIEEVGRIVELVCWRDESWLFDSDHKQWLVGDRYPLRIFHLYRLGLSNGKEILVDLSEPGAPTALVHLIRSVKDLFSVEIAAKGDHDEHIEEKVARVRMRYGLGLAVAKGWVIPAQAHETYREILYSDSDALLALDEQCDELADELEGKEDDHVEW
jgi:hypothetical protein